jgi:hypothetical protein
LNRPSYCFKREFFGSFKTLTRSSTSRLFTEATTGTRPTNSGIRPYLTRSVGSTTCSDSLLSSAISDSDFKCASKPID